MSRVLMLAVGHLVIDFDQGALVILVPALHEAQSLSVGMGASLVATWTFASALLQPLLGHLGDRRNVRWPVPLGMCLAAAGLAMTALAPRYAIALAGTAIGGAGTAAFHPEAARRVAQSAQRWRATAMAYLSVGGNTGYAAGVLLAAPVVVSAGPHAVALFAVPGVAAAILVTRVVYRSRRPGLVIAEPGAGIARRATPVICLLVAVVAIRSTVSVGIAALGPLYLRVDRGLPLTIDAGITAAFLLAGSLGTMAGGTLADRIGRRRQMLLSFAAGPMLGLLFLLLPGWTAYAALILMGAATLSSFAVTVVMAQELIPARVGIASGLVLGVGFAIGGLAVGGLGVLADRVGLPQVVELLCVLPVLAFALVLGIPETGATRCRSPVAPGTGEPPQTAN